MVDFIRPGSAGIADDMREWGQVWGEQDARRQQRWQNQEARRRYDEANRANRHEAVSGREFRQQNAGVFENADAELAGLRPRNVAPAAQPGGAPSLTSEQQAGNAQSANANAMLRRGDTATPPTVDVGADIATATYELRPIVINQNLLRNQSQRSSYERYVNRVNGIRDGRHDALPLRRALDDMVNTRIITQAQANAEYSRILRAVGQETRQVTQDVTTEANANLNRNIRSYNPDVDFSGSEYAAPGPGGAILSIPPADETGVTPEGNEGPTNYSNPPDLNPAPGGLEPPNASTVDSSYRGLNDTSRSRRPTREMLLIETTVNDNLRRADVAAQHGQNEVARVAFAEALQGQAAYFAQDNMLLYHAAESGSLQAAAELRARFEGLRRDEVQLEPADAQGNRFYFQVLNDEGTQWVSSPNALTRSEILGGLRSLVDAAGAAAQTEANTELLRARERNLTDIAVAQIGQQNVQIRAMVDLAIQRMGDQARMAISRGQGRFQIDAENGGVWFTYPGEDAQGNPVPIREYQSIEDVPTPDTNGRRTTEVPTSRRVTGTQGVGTR